MTKVFNYRVIIEQDEDGKYVASVPSMPGCYTEGDTFEEVMDNISDVLKLHIRSRKERGQIIDDTNTEFIGVKTIPITYGVSANR